MLWFSFIHRRDTIQITRNVRYIPCYYFRLSRLCVSGTTVLLFFSIYSCNIFSSYFYLSRIQSYLIQLSNFSVFAICAEMTVSKKAPELRSPLLACSALNYSRFISCASSSLPYSLVIRTSFNLSSTSACLRSSIIFLASYYSYFFS